MKTLIVYESHWGNTASIARAIAAGFGPEARAMATDEVSDAAVMEADLIVAGAPVIAFRLATDKMREGLVEQSAKAPSPADISHPSMRTWLERLPHGQGRSAAFETRIWWSPRGATGDIEGGLKRKGFLPLAKAEKFVVEGTYGPLREGELERAEQWGAELASAIQAEFQVPVGAAG